jgi:hypothetical protein
MSTYDKELGYESKQDEKHSGSDSSPNSDLEIGSVGAVDPSSHNDDEALNFLKNQHDVGELTPEAEKRLLRKIDWMIMPLMWSCYCLQYLDKTLGRPRGRIPLQRLTASSELCGRHGVV